MADTDEPDIKAEIGRNLRELREERGLTQQALAKEADLADETVSRIERGHLNPSAEVLGRLANALKVAAQRLLLMPSAEEKAQKELLIQDIAARLKKASVDDIQFYRELLYRLTRHRGILKESIPVERKSKDRT
ncbi:MAG: helix-turn-helix transcriptional regulator [Nitrospirae bacterium]|nr:helix-turn-helix transcriptional regulator [Nitrospirota bacterium]